MINVIAKLLGIMVAMTVIFIPVFITSKYGMLVGWLSSVSMLFTAHFISQPKKAN